MVNHAIVCQSLASSHANRLTQPPTTCNNLQWPLFSGAYNHAIRHPSNGTNAAFMDGHVESLQNKPQTTIHSDGIGLKAAFDEGLFILKRR